MRTHPHLVHPRQQSYVSQQQSSYMKQQKSALDIQQQQQQQHHYSMQDPYGKTQKRPLGGSGSYLPTQRSFSSSEEELRSTPEFEGKLSHFSSFLSRFLSSLLLKVKTFF
jgi:hypothetical protein